MNNNEHYNKINIRLSMNTECLLSAIIGKHLVTINHIAEPTSLEIIGHTDSHINRSIKNRINKL